MIGREWHIQALRRLFVSGSIALFTTALFLSLFFFLLFLLHLSLILAIVLATLTTGCMACLLWLGFVHWIRPLLEPWCGSRELLSAIGEQLNRTANRDDFLRYLLENLPAQLGFASGRLWLLDPKQEQSLILCGEVHHTPGTVLLVQGASARYVASANHLLAIPQSDAPNWAEPFSLWQVMLLVPLVAHDRLIGIYGLTAPYASDVPLTAHHDLLWLSRPSMTAAVEVMRQQERLAALQEREHSTDQLKDVFIESIGHELRTPLTTLSLTAELLSEQPALPELLVRMLRSSVQQLQSVVDRVLSFEMYRQRAVLEGGDTSALIDTHMLLEDLLVSYQAIVISQGLVLVSQLEPGIRVWGTMARLSRALREVLDNAIRFSKQGTITVTTSFQDGLAIIRIIDQGPGIPEEERERMFTAFYRGRAVRALSESPGTGLGLAIAQHDIDALGGHIWLERSDSKGTEICFALPAILVVDDVLEERAVNDDTV